MRLPIDEDLYMASCYRDLQEPVESARPFKLIHDSKSENAVLLIPGYAGYPGELESPARALYSRGFDVFVIRLPGMGTSGFDFQKTTASDWMTASENALTILMGSYRRVNILGHSMGCLIAILLSLKTDIRAMVLAAPALKLRQKLPMVSLKLMKGMKKVPSILWKPDPDYHLHYEGAPRDDEFLGREYWSHLYPGPFMEMLELQKKALERIRDLDVPVLGLMGEQDPLCVPDSVEMLSQRRTGESQIIRIKEGTHMLYYDKCEKAEEIAVKETVDFLSRLN